MPPDPHLDALIKQLLDSGVAPKYILRLTSELEDHCVDLEDEALRSGVPAEAAANDARSRLGEASTIAREFSKHPELRSWIYNAWWLEALLRAAAGTCLLFAMPVRAFVQSETLMRFAAAAVAGAMMTLGMLLAMYLAVSSGSGSYQSSGSLRDSAGTPEQRPHFSRASVGGASSGPSSAEAEAVDGRAPESRPPGRAADASPENAARRRSDASGFIARRRPRGAIFELPQQVRLAAIEPASAWTLPPPAASSELRIRSGFGVSDQELRPIAKVESDYPSAAARRGLEGYAVVEYTVTRAGAVSEIAVVESSNDLFNRAAIEAASGLRFTPRIIGGSAVDVSGVRTTIRFLLEE